MIQTKITQLIEAAKQVATKKEAAKLYMQATRLHCEAAKKGLK